MSHLAVHLLVILVKINKKIISLTNARPPTQSILSEIVNESLSNTAYHCEDVSTFIEIGIQFSHLFEIAVGKISVVQRSRYPPVSKGDRVGIRNAY